MSGESNISANISSENPPLYVPRRPGRPRGSKNRTTVAVEAAMRPLERHAKRTLKELMAPEKEAAIRLKAAELVLAYRFGRPRQRSEFSGPDGQSPDRVSST